MVADATISDLRIANMALSNLGAARIESLTEASTEAKEVNLWLEFTRLQALAAYDWGFARRRVTLTLHGEQPSSSGNDPWAGVWGYRYVYPGDCVSLRKIQNPNSPPDDAYPFDIETQADGKVKTILTDVQYAVAVYTFNTTYADQYSPEFVIAMSHLLASHMAMSLTGSRGIKQAEEEMAFRAVMSAGAADANERVDPAPREADWIRGRL